MEIPQKPGQEAKIAFAGPLMSLVIGFICLFTYNFVIASNSALSQNPIYLIIWVLGSMNLVLGIFNLLPAFPMDGGRILRSFLARKMSYVKATHSAASIGKFIAILMPGIKGADLFISRSFKMPAAEANRSCNYTFNLSESLFNAPEATCSKGCFFQAASRIFEIIRIQFSFLIFFHSFPPMSIETISPIVAIEGVTTLSGSKPNLNIPMASRVATKERISPEVKAEITQIRVSLKTPTLSKPRARVAKCPRIPRIKAVITLRIREPEILFMLSSKAGDSRE